MSRALVAGAATAPARSPVIVSSGDPRHAGFEEELRRYLAYWTPERTLRGWIDELWRLGREYATLAARTDRLLAQLQDPALQTHPKWGEGVKRSNAWLSRLSLLDEDARAAQGKVAKAWHALPARTRTTLCAQAGWPQAVTGALLASTLWAMAKRGDEIPDGVCPSR